MVIDAFRAALEQRGLFYINETEYMDENFIFTISDGNFLVDRADKNSDWKAFDMLPADHMGLNIFFVALNMAYEATKNSKQFVDLGVWHTRARKKIIADHKQFNLKRIKEAQKADGRRGGKGKAKKP